MAVSVSGLDVTFTPPPGAVALVGDFTDWRKQPPLPVTAGQPLTLRLPRGAWVEYAWLDAAGEVTRLVPEAKRAWHAGASYWRGIRDVNSASVGIELDHPGHANGYRGFSDAQFEAQLAPRLTGEESEDPPPF